MGGTLRFLLDRHQEAHAGQHVLGQEVAQCHIPQGAQNHGSCGRSEPNQELLQTQRRLQEEGCQGCCPEEEGCPEEKGCPEKEDCSEKEDCRKEKENSS